MVRVDDLSFDNTVIDYCEHDDYANIRVVVPSEYELTDEDIQALETASVVEAIRVERDGSETVVLHYDIEYFVKSEEVREGTKFVWRIKTEQ